MRSLLAVTAAAIILSGCTTRLGDLSVVASKNVGLSTETLRRGVEGRDCTHYLLFIPIGSLSPNLDEAMDRALEQVEAANVLTDIAIYRDLIFTYIYNRSCLRVKADVGELR